MTTFFVDTSVIMYAAGSAHPLRDPCAEVLRRHADREIDAVTSAEVVQEILHRFSRGDRAIGDRMARATLLGFDPVLPVDHDVVANARMLMSEIPDLHARDAVHVATCLSNAITAIVSPDRDFDVLHGITRIDPRDLS